MAHIGINDKKRRNFISPEYRIEEVLPEYFIENYPKLISFLKKYYEWETSSQSPSHYLEHLDSLKDIVDVDADLLQYIEDELLLGQSYFRGFRDRRTAALFANILYKSKGTKFSIQQFFRMFYNTDVDVVYTKQYVFNLNEPDSLIGANSLKYIINDKLYQTYALLIKIGFSASDWRDLYKLFVHPAGFYLGAEVQLVSTYNFDLDNMPGIIPAEPAPTIIIDVGSFATVGFTDMSGIVQFDSDGNVGRIKVGLDQPRHHTLETYIDSSWTIDTLNQQYDNIRELIQRTSPQFDEDDSDGSGIGFSNTVERFDQNEDYYWSSDSDEYLLQIISRDDSAEP